MTLTKVHAVLPHAGVAGAAAINARPVATRATFTAVVDAFGLNALEAMLGRAGSSAGVVRAMEARRVCGACGACGVCGAGGTAVAAAATGDVRGFAARSARIASAFVLNALREVIGRTGGSASTASALAV